MEAINLITYDINIIYTSPLRCKKIVNFIENLEKESIVCLQGIYNLESKKRIEELVVATPKYHKLNIMIDLDKPENNGLAILSPYPVLNCKYYIFPMHNDTFNQYLTAIEKRKKGILYANLIRPNKTIVSVYNLKLQADIKNIISCSEIRMDQINFLGEKINQNIKYLNKFKELNPDFNLSHHHLIAGNLTINDGDALYKFLINKLGFLDVSHINNNTDEIITHPESNQKIDYIFIKNNLDNMESYQVINHFTYNYNYSSHLPLEANLNVETMNNN